MRKILFIVIILVLILGTFLFFNSRTEKITNYPPTGKTIVVLGDSLTEGVGATEGGDFVSVLSKMINEPIINMGVSGETSAEGLARVEEVNAKDPRIVLVLLGGNDYLKKVEKEQTFKNIDEIVRRIQSEGAVVVLLGVQGGILKDNYEKSFEEIAKNRGALYVPNVLDGLIGRQSLMSDAIHPNNAGYQKIAEKIYPVLQKVLQ